MSGRSSSIRGQRLTDPAALPLCVALPPSLTAAPLCVGVCCPPSLKLSSHIIGQSCMGGSDSFFFRHSQALRHSRSALTPPVQRRHTRLADDQNGSRAAHSATARRLCNDDDTSDLLTTKMAHELLIACALACLRMTVSPVASHSLGAPGAFPSSTSNDFSAGADFSASARHRSRAVRARTSFPWPTPHVCRRRARVCSMPLWEESSPQLYWPQSAGEFFLCVRRAAAIGWSEQHGSCGSVAGMLANWTFTETAIPPRGCTASCYVFRSMTPPACAALPTFSLQ